MQKPTTTPTGWVTFQRIRMPDGRILLTQKHPTGATRTIIRTGRFRP